MYTGNFQLLYNTHHYINFNLKAAEKIAEIIKPGTIGKCKRSMTKYGIIYEYIINSFLHTVHN